MNVTFMRTVSRPIPNCFCGVIYSLDHTRDDSLLTPPGEIFNAFWDHAYKTEGSIWSKMVWGLTHANRAMTMKWRDCRKMVPSQAIERNKSSEVSSTAKDLPGEVITPETGLHTLVKPSLVSNEKGYEFS